MPDEARDPLEFRGIHWSSAEGSDDPFLAGASWALSWSTGLVFGPLLGPLFNEAVVTQVEQWNGSTWVPLA